jgi:hypothetical protein
VRREQRPLSSVCSFPFTLHQLIIQVTKSYQVNAGSGCSKDGEQVVVGCRPQVSSISSSTPQGEETQDETPHVVFVKENGQQISYEGTVTDDWLKVKLNLPNEDEEVKTERMNNAFAFDDIWASPEEKLNLDKERVERAKVDQESHFDLLWNEWGF